MKKILCLMLSFMLLTCSFASAADLSFLKNGALMNYSATDTVSITLDMPLDFTREILEYTEGTAIENYIDLERLFASLIESEQTAKVDVKISEDFKRIELGMETEVNEDVELNSNLGITVRAKSGIWMDADFTDAANPRCKMIYSYPYTNKYVVLDLFEMLDALGAAEEAEEVKSMFNLLFDADTLKPLMERSIELIEEHATVTYENRIYTIHFDSAGFSAYMADVINEVVDLYAYMKIIEPTEADEIKYAVLTYAPQISLLGENGYTIEYSVTSKKAVQRVTATADFDIRLKDIVSVFDPSGESWPFESDGLIAFTVKDEMRIRLSGDSVTVKYPELTEENSIAYMDLLGIEPAPEDPEYPDYGYEEYEPIYPHYYTGTYTDTLPQIDGKYYVPLRAILSAAYDEEFTIEFAADETITITSPWFDTIQTKLWSSTATVNGVQIPTDMVILVNGDTTYVSQSFFENLFGWKLMYIGQDFDLNEYYVEFYTYADEEMLY